METYVCDSIRMASHSPLTEYIYSYYKVCTRVDTVLVVQLHSNRDILLARYSE